MSENKPQKGNSIPSTPKPIEIPQPTNNEGYLGGRASFPVEKMERERPWPKPPKGENDNE